MIHYDTDTVQPEEGRGREKNLMACCHASIKKRLYNALWIVFQFINYASDTRVQRDVVCGATEASCCLPFLSPQLYAALRDQPVSSLSCAAVTPIRRSKALGGGVVRRGGTAVWGLSSLSFPTCCFHTCIFAKLYIFFTVRSSGFFSQIISGAEKSCINSVKTQPLL